MKKTKKLLAMLLLGTACVGAFAIAGCSNGGESGGNGGSGDTDITDPDVPLGDGSCKHSNAGHTAAKGSDCLTSGNKEYWYCGDCNKYFSDEACTVETSLAAVTLGIGAHSYGEWIPEDPADCTEDGVKAHKDCTVCHKHFDADNAEITDANLVIAAGHNYGGLIGEVPATTCGNGTKAHYHCDGCGADFDVDKQEFLPPFGDITIYAKHNLILVPEKQATCEEDGVMEAYRHCNDCGKNFDVIALVEVSVWGDEATGHDYPADFTYDYSEKLYKKVCANDEEHVITQAAGTEEFPYLVKNEADLTSAIAKGGVCKLVDDVTLTATVQTYSADKITVNLDGHTITSSVSLAFYINTAAVTDITFSNGQIVAPTTGSGMAIRTNTNCVVTVKNVNITAQYCIYAAVGTINVEGGELNPVTGGIQGYSAKYYADPNTKPEKFEDYDLVVNVSNAKIKSEAANGLGINLRSAYITVSDTEITTANTCVIIYRDCNLTMTDCSMTSKTNCGVQGNGTKLITDTSSKSYYNSGVNTVVSLNNCEIDAVVGIYHPQIDGKLTVTGGNITGTQTAVEVRAGDVELNNVTLISSAESFSAEANKSGSTTCGIALAVSQHTTNDNIVVTLNGCVLEGIYAIFEKDLMDDTQPKDIVITFGDVANTINGYVYSENCDNIVSTADAEGNAIGEVA